MSETNSEENTEIVSLFDEDHENNLKHDQTFFQDKLDKTDIYNKEDEEIYIATSPSFSTVCSKESSMVEFYDADRDNLMKKEISSSMGDNQLKCDATFSSDISNDSHSVEYPNDTYPIANSNIEGQSFFISSDYTHLNNIGIELSKGYFYVLSPMASNSTLLRAPTDEGFTQVDGSTLLSGETLNQTKEISDQITPRASSEGVVSSICNNTSSDLTEFQTTDNIVITQSDISNSTENSRTTDFDHLSTDYNVSFINGIGDSPTKEQQHVTWHKLSPRSDNNEKRSDLPPSLLMKYDNDTNKMEVPAVDGQPYLQVALVNDLDSSTTNEFVPTDQILGVSVPITELFTCKWDGCGMPTLSSQDLIKHVNSSHIVSDHKQYYTCYWNGCVRKGKPFDARYKLVVHLRTHTGEKPHICPYKDCDASFSRPENMKIHMRIHTGEKPYPCQYEGCDKSFANSSDRFKHGRTHKEKQPYRCNVVGCGKSYTDPSTLRKHKKRHANGTLPTPSAKLTIK